MTEYARELDAIRSAGADVVALSVDSAERSEALRRQLGLAFPVLCDTERTVVRAWDLYNPKEMGGIAVPAVFVIDTERRIRYRSIDSTRTRVSTHGVLTFLQGRTEPVARVALRPRVRDIARAIGNALSRGARSK